MTDRELMQQALETLEEINKLSIGENAICLPAEIDGAMDALRERLAQPEQPATKAGELRAMKDEFWKQPEQEPIKESFITHGHLWIGDLYGKEKNNG